MSLKNRSLSGNHKYCGINNHYLFNCSGLFLD
nr:MAG TPA: hypothetical protein [Caudoviricetes sp.]